MKLFPITRQRPNTLLYYILCISLLFFTSACGDTDQSSSDTGSISFSIEWRGAPTIKDAAGSVVTRALDCVASGVATVEAEIYDENNDYLVSGGPWNCSAHAGTIKNVPEGSNRKAVILGKDSSDAIVYQGEKTGINVAADQTTNAGVITTASAIPTNVSATVGDGQVTISWDSVALATYYKIYWATWSGVSKTSYEDTTNSGSSTNPDTTIFERVLSYNGHTYAATKSNMTWEEADTLSNQHGGYLVTINDAQENTFLTDNYSSFISELWIGYNVRDNEDTWVWANGETSTYTSWATYEPNDVDGEDCAVINAPGDWNDVTCTNNSSYAIVEWGAATSYTHTGLTNGTTYYYVVTAVNDYGESDESSEVNTTPSSTSSAYTNSLGMSFQLIPAGTFTMGSPLDEAGRDDDETQHQVTLTQFYIQTTEVTQNQWITVMGSNPSSFSGCSDCPVEQVSWNDVQTFITNLNNQGEGIYRLPTEAEWKYAARAGSTTAFANGDITYYADMIECKYDSNLDAMGWYCYNSSSTQSVGQKDPNAWGLYDMHGNVYEWCEDWYGTYPLSSVTDPTGPLSGSYRVFRGAGWWNYARYCRSAYRSGETPDYIGNVLGFRLVLIASKVPDTGQTTSYTTTFGEDSDYNTINQPSYTDNGNATITDNVTGFIWQKEDEGVTLNWTDAVSYSNNLTLAGYSDWRLPSEYELMSIVNYGTYTPSIDTTYFSGTNTSDYWSTTIYANDSTNAWSVNFYDGFVRQNSKSNSLYVRCIRGQENSVSNFTDNGNGTVADNKTGLLWQQGEGGTKTWENAITYCEDLSLAGYTDWRLPNIKELNSIIDYEIYNPSIDINFFPDLSYTSYYWSSTTRASSSSDAWIVGSNYGDVGYYLSKPTNNYYVRCVRDGQ